MPYEIAQLPSGFWDNLEHYTFNEMALEIAKNLIGDAVPAQDLEQIINHAYDFDAPLHYCGNSAFLELFQGPTLAFKDFGARFMGQLMGYFLRNNDKEIDILVATSGDTGSAVAHGFLNVDGIRVTILYPKGKVSDIQEKQFTTLGANITAIEIDGTFDDCQSFVKQAFLDKDLNEKLTLSSANSINISRLIPQSFYYFYAYKQLENKNKDLYFTVPSGNFGNLTAGLFAKKMGLPVTKMIAATNNNDIFTHYIQTGNFEPKPSVQTISNAMDVGNPSNFFRVLDFFHNDFQLIKENIAAYSYDDESTKNAIKEVYAKYHYVICPHTAVGYLAMQSFINQNNTADANNIILSTAHPVKFGEVVQPILGFEPELPERLKKALGTNKQSIAMKNDYADFKQWLLER
jgi:threonine synthase